MRGEARTAPRVSGPPDAGTLRSVLVVLLAVHSGATDAIGFVALGGAFTSVMTGNMVLLGVAAGRGDGELASHAGAAIVCFILGCAIGARIAGRPRPTDGIWPPAVSRALLVELVITVVFAIGWEVAGGHPRPTPAILLLALNAVGLGIQSSAVQRFGVSGLSTTYLTGTLTTLVMRIATGDRLRDVRHSAAILCGLIAGAFVGTLFALQAAPFAPLCQLACLLTVLIRGWRVTRAVPVQSQSTAS